MFFTGGDELSPILAHVVIATRQDEGVEYSFRRPSLETEESQLTYRNISFVWLFPEVDLS